MTSPTQRATRHGVGALRVLAGIVGAFVIVAAVRLWAPVVCCRPATGDPMGTAAAALASAAMLYLADNGSETCPTGEELKRERFLNPAAYTDDVWGTPFRIECDGGEAVVVSAGPDLAFDTDDDFEASDSTTFANPLSRSS